MGGNVVITMAGFGNRFRKAGYDVPKYRVEAHGRTLFYWSMLSLMNFARAGWTFHFVVRRADEAGAFLDRECANLGIRAHGILELATPTDGQATTALLAARAVKNVQESLVVYNIDTFVEPDALLPESIRGAGWIPCCRLPGDSWSFVRADADGLAHEVREKNRISDWCTIGLYHFRSFGLYEKVYREFYAKAENVEAGERYIAPMYNHLIANGEKVYVAEVPISAFHALGTPAEVESFIAGPRPAIRVC